MHVHRKHHQLLLGLVLGWISHRAASFDRLHGTTAAISVDN
jgi:hypothetical protein